MEWSNEIASGRETKKKSKSSITIEKINGNEFINNNGLGCGAPALKREEKNNTTFELDLDFDCSFL